MSAFPVLQSPPFTAIVAAWNESHHLTDHMHSFSALTRPDCELIISAGGNDGSYAIAKRLACHNIRVIEQLSGQGKQSALRACLQHATHDLLYFTDADCEFNADVIAGLLDHLSSGDRRACTGGCRPREWQMGNPFVQYQACQDLITYDRTNDPPGLLGRNFAITRKALDSVGGLREHTTTGTDYQLGLSLRKAGIPIAYARRSWVATDYPQTSAEYLRHARRWIKNPVILEPVAHLPGFTVSVCLAAGLILGPVLTVMPAGAWTRAWFVLLGIVFVRRLRMLARGRAKGIPVGLRAVADMPWFAFLDQVAVLAAACDILTPSRRAKW